MAKHNRLAGLAMAALLAAGTAGLAQAAVPEPRLKPANAAAQDRLLQGAEYQAFKAALEAARVGDWRTHARESAKVSDTTAQNVLAWANARGNTQVDFRTQTHVVQNLSDWPGSIGIAAKAEKRLFASPLGAAETIAWFGDREPVSGEGRIALARAYLAQGDTDRGMALLRSAWRDSKLTRDAQREVFTEFGSRLTKADHDARVDHLIWSGKRHFDKAKALLPQLENDRAALHRARMALIERRPNVTALINAVPADLRNSPELNFERARWRRKKLDKEEALAPLLAMKAPVADTDGRDDVWREKRLMTYWLLSEGRFAEAYPLTINHGLTEGLAFQEAEFMAGWLALQKLGKPQLAEQHFRTLYAGVDRSISKSRGAYWLARSLDAQGKTSANTYRVAAQFPNTYYGQLASRKTGEPGLVLPADPAEPELLDTRAKAMRLLGEANELRLLETFSFALDDDVTSLPDVAAVAALAESQGSLKASVRAAKQAARFGGMLSARGYPMPVSITSLNANDYDIPFTLAIARQESEFDPSAVSSARAYGLMQMIDGTAKATARKHGLKYSRQRMLSDEYYAARMGSLHLNDLLQRYDGSYIMAAAAYNAGPSRVTRWNSQFGDPRLGEIDPIDWVESIPFSETRNYVQRVMENMQVYRARLNDNQAPNLIVEALSAGARRAP